MFRAATPENKKSHTWTHTLSFPGAAAAAAAGRTKHEDCKSVLVDITSL